MSPTINTAALSGTAFRSACISMISRSFVNDQKVAIERVVITALEAAGLRINLKETMDRLGLETCRFGHALRASASRGAQQKHGCLSLQEFGELP